MRIGRDMAGIAAALAVLCSLAACTPTVSSGGTERASAVPAAATVDAAPTSRPLTLEPGLTVATGQLQSADGLSSGRVSVVSAPDGEFDLVIDDFASPVTSISLNVTTEPFTEAGYCAAAQVVWVLEPPQAAPRIVARIGLGDEQIMDDPSFLDTVLLTVNEADAPRTGCFYPVFASTDLVWTMPDLRPDIVVADSGPTGGAMGEVEMHGDRVGSYTVAPGDLLPEIAARFGITVDDLLYLSPGRMPGTAGMAYVDEVFTLDKATR
jgi:hypothetical protein